MAEALARAVAAPGVDVLLLDGANRNAGRVTLDEALATGAAYGVEVRGRLLAVDYDGDRDDPYDGRLRRLVGACRRAGVPAVVEASGQPGRRHVWIVVGDATPEATRSRLAEAVGALLGGDAVRQGTSRIRPPLSPHRLGPRFAPLISPRDPGRALETLTGPAPPATAVAALAGELAALGGVTGAAPAPADLPLRAVGDGRLSPRISALLRDGDRAGQYRKPDGTVDRSRLIMAVAVGAVNAGWTFRQFADAMLDEANVAGEKVRRQPPGEQRRWLGATWRRAVELCAASPALREANEVRAAVPALRSAMIEYAWPGRTGPSNVAVLGALLDLVETHGRWTVGASVRQLAAGARRAVGTVVDVLGRLVDAGAVRRTRAATPIHGAELTVVPNAPCFVGGANSNTPSHAPKRDGSVQVGSVDHDAWERAGLGTSAYRAAHVLHEEDGQHARQVAEQLGHSVRWTRELLSRLQRHGLAARDGDRLWTAAPPERWPALLDDAAQQLGTAGARTRRQARHEAERQQRARQLDVGRVLIAQWIDMADGEVLGEVHDWPPPRPYRPEADVDLDELADACADAIRRSR